MKDVGMEEIKLKVRKIRRARREAKYRHYPLVDDHSTAAHEYWEPIVNTGLWSIKGYQVVKGPWGGGTVKEALKREPKEFMVIDRAAFALYSHSYGLVSPFFRGLLEGKLKGTKCPKCGTVYCPPRAHCWNPKCRVADCKWIDLPLTGVIHTFTVQCLAAAPFEHQLPFPMGWVKIDGADTTLAMMYSKLYARKEITMNDVHKVSPITLMLMVLALISACGPKNIPVRGYDPTVDISELELDKSKGPHIAYMRPGAPGLGPLFIIRSTPPVFSE